MTGFVYSLKTEKLNFNALCGSDNFYIPSSLVRLSCRNLFLEKKSNAPESRETYNGIDYSDVCHKGNQEHHEKCYDNKA